MKKSVFKMSLIIALAMSVSVLYTSCNKPVEATITRVYQPIAGGMVHTWLAVKFDNDSTANVVLPDDDAVWNKARQMKGQKVEVQKQNGKWQFIKFLE